MSRGRRQVIQLDEPGRVYYSNEPTPEIEEEDDDSAGDMPTPERLVTDDMIPAQPNTTPAEPGRGSFEIDNKVANFLAEIDALDPGGDADNSQSPAPHRNLDGSPPRDKYSPVREKSPVRTKSNAYSSMFVKGTPEFVKKPEDKSSAPHSKKLEPWPEEPKSDWQQLTDEKTNYPYYWNMVTNEVVWEMPAEFSQFLLRQKEYEEKVERGLKEGTLDPSQRGKPAGSKHEEKEDQKADKKTSDKPSKSSSRHSRYTSHSEDSSSDSIDSDDSRSRDSLHHKRKSRSEKTLEVTSSSAENSRSAITDKVKRSSTPDRPDSTRSEDKRVSTSKQASKDTDSLEFDIDDIDKELEMALERKRQELMKMEGKKGEESEEDKPGDRKRGEHRHHDDDKHDDRHRKHGRHRDSERDRDMERKREKDDKKPKLTLKERLRVEMELKTDKERRRKRAIEEMMARELEQTVGPAGGRHKRHRDDRETREKSRYDRGDYRSQRDEYGDYARGYDDWGGRGTSLYDDRLVPPPSMKPPPPTDEMIAYEEERRSQVVDYGHGRSRLYDMNGDSESEESRSADVREMEVKKLEALQLAELALSKLEFLEVTKKGLSKLQILLIELETRHQDWQAGGLTTNHFLSKLREANWQLEQYEASAAPSGWVCSWDRDYRRYFYTHKLTGKNQWDYPDADQIKAEDEKGHSQKGRFGRGRDLEPEITSTSDRGKTRSMEKDILASMALPPPPPPPAEEHPSVKSLMLMYGSSSESEPEEPTSKKAKKEAPSLPDLENVPLPPEEPHREKDKKERHKKKKKKEKSKKKEREKTSEAGLVGPVGPVFPPVSIAAPPPPPEAETDAEPQLPVLAGIHSAQEVPVYGSVDDEQGQNDLPLEFGTVPQEMTGNHPYATENMEGVETGSVISHGPQVASSSAATHEMEANTATTSGYTDPYGLGEAGVDGYQGETTLEATGGAVPGTEEKKKKKKDKMGSGSISLKKKHVSSMVQKWQKVKKEVELEEQHRQIREAEIRRKLAELE